MFIDWRSVVLSLQFYWCWFNAERQYFYFEIVTPQQRASKTMIR